MISVPTGVGKTAIALAAPYLAAARRTLVIVPSQELRRQTAERFEDQGVLRAIGAIDGEDTANPKVAEVQGRERKWEELERADVVIGLPASLSPHPDHEDLPPDFFDLVIVDEAHHAPATTWQALLDHFEGRQLLLTATPNRRDGKRLPGQLVYYYPLRQALDEGLYQPVQPVLLSVPPGQSAAGTDVMVATTTLRELARDEHQSSQLLIRANSKKRARQLADIYAELGAEFPVLHSGLTATQQAKVIADLRLGRVRGLVMVGMLVEGFDLPSLRVAAYHDKHKSLGPTAQLLGRLARVSAAFPQQSVLVAAKDVDTYPELKGSLRRLYEEDRDWAKVLPGIIDDVVEEDLSNLNYARSFGASEGIVDPAQLHPLRRFVAYEVLENDWKPTFAAATVPAGIAAGESLAGQTVVYAGVDPSGRDLVVVTVSAVRPRWSAGEALDATTYDLHVLSHRRTSRTDKADLFFVNTASTLAARQLVDLAGAKDVLRPADAGRLETAFDSVQRLSVSSVGVRNTYGPARGTPSYRMFAGSSIETGLRDSDTAQASLGHAMAQVASDGGTFTAGLSTGKSKYWETRYTPLRLYGAFIDDFTDRYHFPVTSPSGPLLPHINRGVALTEWPASEVLAVAPDHALLGSQWAIDGRGSIDLVDLLAGQEAVALGAPAATSHTLPLAAQLLDGQTPAVIWVGHVALTGEAVAVEPDVIVRRGHGNPTTLAALLTRRPPTIFFVDGTTTRGRESFPAAASRVAVPEDLVTTHDWSGVDLRSETPSSAAKRGVGISVHEWLERYLTGRVRRGTHRWICNNDGSGELADYVVIERLSNGQMSVELWHAKFAGGEKSSVRSGDFEVVTSQAVKSRRWPTDLELWERLARRLDGRESPALKIIEGRRLPLEILLGLHPRWVALSAKRRKPSVVGTIGIVQPGLSLGQLQSDLDSDSRSAMQVAQLLTVFRDAVLGVAQPVVLAAE